MEEGALSRQIASDQIHAWFGSLDCCVGAVFDRSKLLSLDERHRAAQFHFEIHRNRFVAARCILRGILANYLGVQPESLTFRYGGNGKPELMNGGLHFNLSHSEDRVLVAVSSCAPLGVDLERIQPVPDNSELASQFFSPSEVQALAALPQSQQAEAFLSCWTRKEAFLKALGDGLSYPLHRFSVSLDEPTRLLDIEGDAEAAAEWMICPLKPEPCYVGAIATRQLFSQIWMKNLPLEF